MTESSKERARVTALVRDHITKMAASGKTMQAIATELGISKAYVVQIRKKFTAGNVGPDVESAVARKFYGGSVDTLRKVAAEKFPSVDVPEESDSLDPKEAVRRGPVYASAPPEVQHAFDYDDEFTRGKDTSRLTVRVYSRRLESLWGDFDAGVLPVSDVQLPGTDLHPNPPDPDAPPRAKVTPIGKRKKG